MADESGLLPPRGQGASSKIRVASAFAAFLVAMERGGVAPISRDSGTMRGKRTTWGSRKVVRSALYMAALVMAALVAIRYKPVIRAHYEKLLTAGKARKLALVACMRKRLVMRNAILRTKTPWKNSLETT